MTKSLKTLLLAACILTTSTSGLMSAPTTYAYTQLIASLQEVSVFKDTLAIGEKAQLELTWSNGAHPELIYSSSDESVATVDQDGIVTGIANGTATITVSRLDGKNTKTLDISVSSDVEKSIVYNTSELNLGDKLRKYDILHYDNKNKGANANVVNTKGSYDLVFINEKDFVLPFDAEYVGDWGSCMYLAPDIEGITYLDGRTLNVDDVIDRNTHLLCYDYYIKSADSSNRMTFPVFLPEYYGKYIGNGEIRLNSIDHDSKTIELKSVPVDSPASKLLYVEITRNPYDTVIHGSDELDLTGLRLTIGETDGNGDSISQLENITIDEARKTYDITVEIKDEAPGSGNCQIIVTKKNEEISDTASFAVSYGAPVVKGDVNSDGELNIADAVLLQKWLLAFPDTNLPDWNRADLYRDGRLDVFDLCLMKRALIEKMNDIPQNGDTSFKFQSVADIRTNGDNHTKWTGYIARSESDLLDIIQENEDVSADEISLEDIDDNAFNDKSLVIIYGICTAGNSYSIIDDISINGTDIDVSTVSKKPEIATPDMMYRRYIYIIDKNAVKNISGFTFNDTYSFYQNDEESDVVNWFKDWCRS